MPIRVFHDGRVTLPESIRALFQILPGDPMLYQVEGAALVLTRVTRPGSQTAPRRRQPGRVLPWRDVDSEPPSAD